MARAMLNEKQGSTLLTAALAGRELRTDVARDILRVLRESGRTDADLPARHGGAVRRGGRVAFRDSAHVCRNHAIVVAGVAAEPAHAGPLVVPGAGIPILGRCFR